MSYELEYTKEKWINVGIDNLIIAADTDAGEAIADCDISYLIKKNEKIANATLIAAAPKMFELLKKIESTYDKGTETYKQIHNLLTEITK